MLVHVLATPAPTAVTNQRHRHEHTNRNSCPHRPPREAGITIDNRLTPPWPFVRRIGVKACINCNELCKKYFYLCDACVEAGVRVGHATSKVVSLLHTEKRPLGKRGRHEYRHKPQHRPATVRPLQPNRRSALPSLLKPTIHPPTRSAHPPTPQPLLQLLHGRVAGVAWGHRQQNTTGVNMNTTDIIRNLKLRLGVFQCPRCQAQCQALSESPSGWSDFTCRQCGNVWHVSRIEDRTLHGGSQ